MALFLTGPDIQIPDQVENAARQALQLGVTTQLDMFSGGDRLRQIKRLESEDRPDLSDLRTAGIGGTVPGGHPTQMGGPAIPTINSPDPAQEFVDARIAEGSDYIKIIHDDGSTWTWTSPYIAPEFRQRLEMAKPDASKNHFCNGTDEAIRQSLRERVPILAGTDAPVPGATYGASVHGELALLVGDGMTPIQALAAATSVPARIFRLSDRGAIKRGMHADLVLVQGDSTENILDTRKIVAVWKRGVRVQRSERYIKGNQTFEAIAHD